MIVKMAEVWRNPDAGFERRVQVQQVKAYGNPLERMALGKSTSIYV